MQNKWTIGWGYFCWLDHPAMARLPQKILQWSETLCLFVNVHVCVYVFVMEVFMVWVASLNYIMQIVMNRNGLRVPGRDVINNLWAFLPSVLFFTLFEAFAVVHGFMDSVWSVVTSFAKGWPPVVSPIHIFVYSSFIQRNERDISHN